MSKMVPMKRNYIFKIFHQYHGGAGVGRRVLSKDDTDISLTFPTRVSVDFTEKINAIAHNLQIKRELNF